MAKYKRLISSIFMSRPHDPHREAVLKHSLKFYLGQQGLLITEQALKQEAADFGCECAGLVSDDENIMIQLHDGSSAQKPEVVTEELIHKFQGFVASSSSSQPVGRRLTGLVELMGYKRGVSITVTDCDNAGLDKVIRHIRYASDLSDLKLGQTDLEALHDKFVHETKCLVFDLFPLLINKHGVDAVLHALKESEGMARFSAEDQLKIDAVRDCFYKPLSDDIAYALEVYNTRKKELQSDAVAESKSGVETELAPSLSAAVGAAGAVAPEAVAPEAAAPTAVGVSASVSHGGVNSDRVAEGKAEASSGDEVSNFKKLQELLGIFTSTSLNKDSSKEKLGNISATDPARILFRSSSIPEAICLVRSRGMLGGKVSDVVQQFRLYLWYNVTNNKYMATSDLSVAGDSWKVVALTENGLARLSAFTAADLKSIGNALLKPLGVSIESEAFNAAIMRSEQNDQKATGASHYLDPSAELADLDVVGAVELASRAAAVPVAPPMPPAVSEGPAPRVPVAPQLPPTESEGVPTAPPSARFNVAAALGSHGIVGAGPASARVELPSNIEPEGEPHRQPSQRGGS